jgi:DNA-binding NtrC family response regulator
MEVKRILIVDDEKRQRNTIKEYLDGEGYLFSEANTLEDACSLSVKGQHDLVLLDVMLGNVDSIQMLMGGQINFNAPVVIVTGRRGEPLREEAVGKFGIVGFLYKPYKEAEIREVVKKAFQREVPHVSVRDELKANYDEKGPFSAIVCACNAMVEAQNRIKAFAKNDATVLIRGDSGTGKELVARQIHAQSKRKEKPFVAVNCAAIPETLLESELFGYAPQSGIANANPKGKPGKFELANGGAIFLDEIGDMPLYTQAKLLRVLETQEVDRLSGTAPIRVDVRIITATNQDLEAHVLSKRFREDLYYRIKVAEIKLPPIRLRGDDARLLIEHFLRAAETEISRTFGITEEALDLLLNYRWPGNVRELEHAIESAVALTYIHGDVITKKHLPDHVVHYQPMALTAKDIFESKLSLALSELDFSTLKKEDISQYMDYLRFHLLSGVLQAHGGNQAEAARQLDVGEKFFSQAAGFYQRYKREGKE